MEENRRVRMAIAVFASAIAACGKSNPTEPSPAPRQPSAATQPSTPSADAAARGARQTNICSGIDAKALARAVGARQLLPSPSNGLIQAEVDEHSVSCEWNSNRQEFETEFSFSVSLPADIDRKDARFEWDDFDGFGQPAKIGVSSGGLYIQTIAKDVLLNASLDNPAEPHKSRFDKRLVAAMKIVMEQLPGNVQDTLR
jgi:hypothetical protein